MKKKISKRVQFLDDLNIIVFDGVPISGELLSELTRKTKPKVWFRIDRRADSVLTISVGHEEKAKR